ncbi:hypothetical protein [Deinococcus alpinitundrae]|uniref:hypothetical protein n=1 Tax=Deinococcus alpinitundrae TaxID=468913 RepID=UPI0013798E37|nr:hypothetical protein [Deinococcus alpinitundrae]
MSRIASSVPEMVSSSAPVRGTAWRFLQFHIESDLFRGRMKPSAGNDLLESVPVMTAKVEISWKSEILSSSQSKVLLSHSAGTIVHLIFMSQVFYKDCRQSFQSRRSAAL